MKKRIQISTEVRTTTAYDIIIEAGALTRLPELLAEAAPAHHYLLIADTNTASLYGEEVMAMIEDKGIRTTIHTFEPGEERKTREIWARLTDSAIESGAGRDSVVLALGGGVTGDLAGFTAATLFRGVPLVQIPTSLLAMIDSAVGGKTGVDTPAGKNLVGAFHNPDLVVVDPLALQTLPETELRAGIAEAIKHGAIADAEYLDWIERSVDEILAREPTALTKLVQRSIEIKGDVVERDPFEGGPRMALNFGHTIGHAIERYSDYQIIHGFAIAVGMSIEARIGEISGITEPGTGTRLDETLAAFDLSLELPGSPAPEEIIELTRTDKKARGGKTRYTLLEKIGEVARTREGEWSHEIEDETALAALTLSPDENEV